MKIAILLQFYFPYGGLQRDCLKMAGLLAARGEEVTVVTRSWKGEFPTQFNVEVLGQRGYSNVSLDQNFDKDATAYLADTHHDVVVGFSRMQVAMDFYYAADPCYVMRIRRDRCYLYRLTSKFRYYLGLEKNIFLKGSKTQIILLTDMEIPVYQSYYGTERSRITILPPSIKNRGLDLDSKADLRAKTRLRMGWPEDVPVLVFVGSGFATKGLDRAIRACSGVGKQLKLCVVGDGRTAKYKKLAEKSRGAQTIEFLGPREDAWDLMVAADLLIHPARSENTGTVLVEALSAGTGVLTTDRCGYSSHIAASGAGLVLPSPFEQGALDKAVGKMLTETWVYRAEKALHYAATEDLYSGMESAVQQVVSFRTGGKNSVLDSSDAAGCASGQ